MTFRWPQLTSSYLIWPHVTSCDLMWPHVTSCALYSSQTWSGPGTSCSPPPSARWRGRPTTGSLSVGDFSSGFSLNSDKFWSDWKLYTLYFGFHYPTSTQCQVVCWFDPYLLNHIPMLLWPKLDCAAGGDGSSQERAGVGVQAASRSGLGWSVVCLCL